MFLLYAFIVPRYPALIVVFNVVRKDLHFLFHPYPFTLIVDVNPSCSGLLSYTLSCDRLATLHLLSVHDKLCYV